MRFGVNTEKMKNYQITLVILIKVNNKYKWKHLIYHDINKHRSFDCYTQKFYIPLATHEMIPYKKLN